MGQELYMRTVQRGRARFIPSRNLVERAAADPYPVVRVAMTHENTTRAESLRWNPKARGRPVESEKSGCGKRLLRHARPPAS